MGNQTNKPNVKMPTLEDNIIEMKIQVKTLARASKKLQKESATYQKKAKQALQKNNEESAKMYLMSASIKSKQVLNIQRTAMKIQFMCDKIKSMKSNQKLISTFSLMTNAVSQSMNNFDAAKMMQSMQTFNTKMDQMMINNKMMMEIAEHGEVENGDMVEQMKIALMEQIAMEEKHRLEGDIVNNQNKKIKQENDKFLDQLKGL